MTNHIGTMRRIGKFAVAGLLLAATSVLVSGTAGAAIVPTVQLATAGNFSVLAGETVTNTGGSILHNSLGLSPGTSVVGFPPGKVLPPATIEIDNGVAEQAKRDLELAYVDAEDRPVTATITAELSGLVLQGGVYAADGKGALLLSGPSPLVLDGNNNRDSVFIFQTDSSLTTGVGSSIELIRGAQACNVFWQVGSSATLNQDSVFVGNILALTSVFVKDNVTVHGRALARNGEVTLENDTFTKPTCLSQADTTTTSTIAVTSTTSTTTAVAAAGVGSGAPGNTTAGATVTATGTARTTAATPAPAPATPRGVVGPPRTGGAPLETDDSGNRNILFATVLIVVAGYGGRLAWRGRTLAA